VVENYPFFTVAIPVYNRITFIKKAVQSVLDQNFTNFELVIVDNKSTDGTWEYLKSISDRRVRIFQNEKNIGMLPNFKRCIQEARGKWFKFLMSDDYLLADSLEYLKDIILRDGEDATYLANGFFKEGEDATSTAKGLFNQELSHIKENYQIISHDTKKALENLKKYIYVSIPANPNSYTMLTSDLKNMIETEEYLKMELNYGQTGHCVDYFIFYFNAKKHSRIIEIRKPLYVLCIHENSGHKKYVDNFEYHIKGDIFMIEQIFLYRQKVDIYLLKHMLLTLINKNRAKKSIPYLFKTSSEFIKVIKEI
jgi:glycosyltransferase involved in cell wall biosynthesis